MTDGLKAIWPIRASTRNVLDRKENFEFIYTSFIQRVSFIEKLKVL